MASNKPPKTLYFLRAAAPTDAQVKDAATYGFGVVFRNALHVPTEGALEQCDAVCGDIPSRYQKAFPLAKRVMLHMTDAPAPVPFPVAGADEVSPGAGTTTARGLAPGGATTSTDTPQAAPVAPAAPTPFPGATPPAAPTPPANPPNWKPGQ